MMKMCCNIDFALQIETQTDPVLNEFIQILSSYLQWFPLLEEAVKWKYIHHLPVLILQATSDKYSVYRNNCLIANFSVQYYYIFSTAAYKYMK